MTYYKRCLNLPDLLKKKSFFLLGPRATGKSSLIKKQLSDNAIILDLLRGDLFLRLSARPSDLEAIIKAELEKHPVDYIVMDEIQKLPLLLDEVHRLIETYQWRFLLTGSSARKLKHGHANLLAGRAWIARLHPLCWKEIPDFDLTQYLRYGGLPAIYDSEFPEEELNAYANTYLYEEIQAEGIVRKLPQFSRFLKVAALSSGQMLNFSQIASDTGVPASTVREYYSILEDTLLGFMLPPWVKSEKRKAIATAKFYLFDLGVTHTLAGTKNLDRNSDLYGRSFEHWIGLELRSYLDYHRINETLCYWQSRHQHEVDFIVGDDIAIEIKAARKITPRDLKNLKILQEEGICKQFFLVSHDSIEMKQDNIWCMHWKTFIERLWSGSLIEFDRKP